jgi:hypothetical protein
VTPKADGTFTHTVDLAEGRCIIVVHAVDGAGNVARVARTVTLDSTPPNCLIAFPPNDYSTNLRSVEVSGTVDPDATIYIDGQMLMHDGGFSATVILNEGTNTIKVRVVDPTGNERTHTLTVVLDTEAPIILIAQPAGHQFMTNSPDVVIVGTILGDIASLNVGGRDVQVGEDGHFTCTVTVQARLTDLVVVAVDHTGNRAEFTIHVDLDTELPALGVDHLPAGGTVEATDNSLVITGHTSVDVSMVEVTHTVVGVTVTDRYYPIGPDGTFTIVRRLAEGQNTIVLRVVDSHGNANETTPYDVTYKYVPPKGAVMEEEEAFDMRDVALVIAAFSIALIVIVVLVSRGFSQKRP